MFSGVEDAGCITGEELHDPGTFLVFLNGGMLGVHRRPRQFLYNFRHLRRLGKVSNFFDLYSLLIYDNKSIHPSCYPPHVFIFSSLILLSHSNSWANSFLFSLMSRIERYTSRPMEVVCVGLSSS